MTPTATEVLLDNWRSRYTVPAPGLYPHQWSWDSAFIAFGLRHLSARRAQQELESLWRGQWPDGRLPQIVFDTRRDDDYSPGASFWLGGGPLGAPAGVATSGLVQPPVHAWAVLAVHRADPAESRRRGFLARAYPRLLAWHEYLRTRRDRGGRGLAAIVHPWESGMDNSPVWDAALAGVPRDGTGGEPEPPRPDLLHADASERPTQRDYGRYLWLAARYRDHGCDDRDPDHPFLVEDPAVNGLWAVSELALAEIARELGLPPGKHTGRAAELVAALEPLWQDDLGLYVARDVRSGARTTAHASVAGLVPLLVPGLPHAADLLRTLRGPRFALGRVQLVPSYDLTAPGFDPARYWRGPSWFNVAWLLVQALRGNGSPGEGDALADQACRLAAAHGFPEYLDPHTGSPHGTRRFSWTAALALDLQRGRRPGRERVLP